MTKKLAVILWVGIVSLWIGQALAQDMKILTTEEPPMNYMDQGIVTGFSTEIVKEIMKRTETKGTVDLMPWARAYDTGLKESNVVLFTMARTTKRENLFYWVGPIVGKRWVLFAKNSGSNPLSSLEDAKPHITGVMLNDARAVYLKEQGFQHVQEVSDHVQALKMLMRDRVDYWASSDFEGPIIVKQTAFEFNDIKVVFPLKRIESYIGISKATSPELAQQWQRTFAQLKADGTIARIAAKWAESLNIPITGKNGIITFVDY